MFVEITIIIIIVSFIIIIGLFYLRDLFKEIISLKLFIILILVSILIFVVFPDNTGDYSFYDTIPLMMLIGAFITDVFTLILYYFQEILIWAIKLIARFFGSVFYIIGRIQNNKKIK